MKIKAVSVSIGLVLSLSTGAYADEIVVSGNGTESNNQVSISANNTTTTQQTNTADVQNTVAVDANTGNNSASTNTGGDTGIQTGSIDVNSSIENSLNASTVQSTCCQNGIDGTITGNGSDSQNTVNLTYTSTDTITVFQNATIYNTILGSANTGGNTANDNGGHVSINTGSIYVSENIKNGPINSSSIKGSTGFGRNAAFSIFGNGTGSTNTINASLNASNNVYNIFNANIVNNSVWDLNTGNNYANGNIGGVDLKTGDITFATFLVNGPINFSKVDVTCCHEYEKPGVGGENPKEQKENPSAPAGSVGGSSSSGSSNNGGNGGSSGGGGIGSLLPTTGSLTTLIMTLGSIVLFFFGWYLRFRSGNAPPRLALATA